MPSVVMSSRVGQQSAVDSLSESTSSLFSKGGLIVTVVEESEASFR